MKKIAILVLSVLILSTIFSGCVNKNSIDDLLLDVLNNEQTFIDESNEHIYLKDYKLKENKDIKIIPQKYALIDFDNDGINELVVYISENYGAYIIFHMYAGNIYGFEFMERAMIDLKTDGSFIQSEGAGINAYARLTFDENGYDIFEEAYSNDIDNVYEINEKESTSEKVNNYKQKYEKKESVNWKEISTVTLSAGTPNTPTTLMSSIKSKTGYETLRAVQYNTNIGYVNNGVFVPVTVSTFARNSNIDILNTQNNPIEFIIPINFNPNSSSMEVWHAGEKKSDYNS